MATFKTVILPQNKRGDGTYNIKIRVIHARKTKYVATQWYASAKDMTRSMKLKNQMLIDAAEDLIRTYREICNKIGARLDDMTVEQVVKMISKSAASGSRFRLDFFDGNRWPRRNGEVVCGGPGVNAQIQQWDTTRYK